MIKLHKWLHIDPTGHSKYFRLLCVFKPKLPNIFLSMSAFKSAPSPKINVGEQFWFASDWSKSELFSHLYNYEDNINFERNLIPSWLWFIWQSKYFRSIHSCMNVNGLCIHAWRWIRNFSLSQLNRNKIFLTQILLEETVEIDLNSSVLSSG